LWVLILIPPGIDYGSFKISLEAGHSDIHTFSPSSQEAEVGGSLAQQDPIIKNNYKKSLEIRWDVKMCYFHIA
jgi:hypothetical protein